MTLRFLTHRPQGSAQPLHTGMRHSSLAWFVALSGGFGAMAVGCGDDVKCPRGTSGSPCRFDDDIGVAPTSPPLTVNDATTLDAETTDIGPEPDGASDAGSDASSESRSSNRREGSSLVARSHSTDGAGFARTTAGDSCVTVAPGKRSRPGEHQTLSVSGPGARHADHHETPNAHIDAGPGTTGLARTHAPTWSIPWGNGLHMTGAPLVTAHPMGPDERQPSGA